VLFLRFTVYDYSEQQFVPSFLLKRTKVLEKDGYAGKKGSFLRNFFEFPGDFHLEIPWQGHTTEDTRENLFHYLSAFRRGGKLTNRLPAFRC
jgi:hypothetical protein